jgi:hypothetical protein
MDLDPARTSTLLIAPVLQRPRLEPEILGGVFGVEEALAHAALPIFARSKQARQIPIFDGSLHRVQSPSLRRW